MKKNRILIKCIPIILDKVDFKILGISDWSKKNHIKIIYFVQNVLQHLTSK